MCIKTHKKLLKLKKKNKNYPIFKVVKDLHSHLTK